MAVEATGEVAGCFAAEAEVRSWGFVQAVGLRQDSLQGLVEVFVADSRLDTAAEVFDLDP